mmetsp:Transcript_32202/g.80212  ORF Transcript_32202/g.80212 Transcript_32202/m.80212 type:complete len:92 (-) Transcript_32202:515-790(-)
MRCVDVVHRITPPLIHDQKALNFLLYYVFVFFRGRIKFAPLLSTSSSFCHAAGTLGFIPNHSFSFLMARSSLGPSFEAACDSFFLCVCEEL